MEDDVDDETYEPPMNDDLSDEENEGKEYEGESDILDSEAHSTFSNNVLGHKRKASDSERLQNESANKKTKKN